MIDIRQEIPDLAPYIRDYEEVTSIERPPLSDPAAPPLSTRIISQISGADSFSSVGKTGYPRAATCSPENGNVACVNIFGVGFGRDSLYVSRKMLQQRPLLMRATLVWLAEKQGQKFNLNREEEEGRILHEDRDPATDSRAQEITKTSGWEWPYYGSIDATPLFISSVIDYCSSSEEGLAFLAQPVGRSRTMAHSLDRAIFWQVNKLGQNKEGLFESKPMLETGLGFQGWQDSWDACHHKNGQVANLMGGVATVENQVLANEALMDAAEFYTRHQKQIQQGHPELEIPHTVNLEALAKNLEHQVMTTMWDEGKGYFILGTDRDEQGNLRKMEVFKSNAGHVLKARFFKGDKPEIVRRRQRLIQALFSDKMLGPAGIRTLANDSERYKPTAYHNGTTWIFDSGIIADGLRENDIPLLADELDRRHLRAAWDTGRLPEHCRGDGDSPQINRRIVLARDYLNGGKEHKIEQPPQEYQGWTAAWIAAVKFRLAHDRLSRNGHYPASDETRELQQEILQSLPQAA